MTDRRQPMTLRWSLTRTAGFAVLYLIAAYVGRLTIMDRTNLSLVWPAAGVGAVWFVAQHRSRWYLLDAAALAAVTVAINMATGASAAVAAVFVVANIVQATAFAALFGRWLPGLWGSGGTAQISRPQQLWRLVAIAVLTTLLGALVGPTGVWLVTGHYSFPAAAVWMARNSGSMLLIGAAGLRFGALYAARRRAPGAPAVAERPGAWLEGFLLIVVSTAAYVGVFAFTHGLPLAFVLITVTVWAGSRMNTTFVILHDLVFGGVAVLFTLYGDGPFAAIGSHPVRALVAQLFVAVVAVVGLAVALGRDESVGLREAAAEQARIFATVIDSMTEGLSVIDERGHVLLRNPAIARLLGGDTTGDASHGLFHDDGTLAADGDLPHQRALATGEPHAMDLIVRNGAVPQGRTLAVRATPLPGEINGRRYAVSVFSDVTAERRHRDELAAFAGVVAHDLCNPLAIVEGWSEDVADILADQGGQAADGMVRIRRAAERMRRLITDLLAYTTARDTPLALTVVDLADLVAEIAVAHADQAGATGTPVPRIRVGDLPAAHADRDLTRQLLDNLVRNAIRYTAPGTTPVITVEGTAEGGHAHIRVTDNGIGIPGGQHRTVFENFHRAHPGTSTAGTGLGLAICKRIAERHGGTINAAGNPDGPGTTFTFTLPCADLPAARPRAACEAK